jgi:hypothetical protein
MIKRLERLKNSVNINMADIRPVKTEVGRKSTTKCICNYFQASQHPNGTHVLNLFC